METKVCSRCGKEKPLSEFYNRKANKDGKDTRCKICARMINRKSKLKKREQKFDEKDFDKINGGYKIYILNHTKQGEHKYTVVGTNGNFFCAEKKTVFIQYLREILEDD